MARKAFGFLHRGTSAVPKLQTNRKQANCCVPLDIIKLGCYANTGDAVEVVLKQKVASLSLSLRHLFTCTSNRQKM